MTIDKDNFLPWLIKGDFSGCDLPLKTIEDLDEIRDHILKIWEDCETLVKANPIFEANYRHGAETAEGGLIRRALRLERSAPLLPIHVREGKEL